MVKMVEFTVFKGSKEGKIVQATTKKDIKADEVLIKVTHSGLCGTDEHFKHADMVLGHEGAGVVEEIGASVTTYSRGDSVGWGYQHDSCNHCKHCLTGHETLCPERAMYGYHDFDQGSFAHYAIWKADYIFKIPDSIPREFAAPLQCGGATVFNALRSFGAKATDRVGIIGIGGLGHLAIQFASKMGCHVTVFSSTDSKRDEAMKLGASEFVATKGVKELQVSGKIDHLLICASFQPDWKQFLPIMAPGGTLYPLTVSQDDLTIPYMPLIEGELRIQGSLVAARAVHNEMFAFAAQHQIRPVIEKFPMTVEGIEACMKKLDEGKMRYRGVLVAP
ncbi:putative NADP-dependent alcohol dehydrogenase C 2 [Leptodontidium sp. 2 PMI_412]|nr:putative NADP-dependent alcohol dehydrogenase C 2 [Leptodontidium sp. 2 PMI_412]